MKLLKKSVLTQELNTQKRLQVDEGVRIATKVDALRSSLNDLETQHQNFVENKQLILDNQFKSLERDIKELKAEIVTLESRKTDLLKPLDEEYRKLFQREETVKAKEHELSNSFLQIKESQQIIKIKENDLNLQMKSLGDRIKANEVETKKTKDNLKTSENKLKKALEREEEVERYISSKTSELRSREANLASRERELDILSKQIELREKEIIKQTILLVDREATLDREIKRQQKKWQQ